MALLRTERLIYTLEQSKYVRGHAGEPITNVWEGINFTKGQLNLVCAGPGCGKSAFVLNLALKSKTPTLYFSADSDAFTQLTRSISIVTGEEQSVVVSNLLAGGDVPDSLSDIPIRLDYEGSPTLEHLDNQMLAYEEVYGVFPELVVVDNITNVRGVGLDDDDPFGGLESLLDYLKTMARKTGACIIGMHHVTGSYNNADTPIPLSGVKGQVGRVPSQIITLHRPPTNYGTSTLAVSTVKKRGGKADPSGETFIELMFDGERMNIA